LPCHDADRSEFFSLETHPEMDIGAPKPSIPLFAFWWIRRRASVYYYLDCPPQVAFFLPTVRLLKSQFFFSLAYFCLPFVRAKVSLPFPPTCVPFLDGVALDKECLTPCLLCKGFSRATTGMTNRSPSRPRYFLLCSPSALAQLCL